ncbi:MAG: lipoyl(octanoyl) transferase LipB [Candidatus Marinimicrobia bacterium]|nr:lipoyl(octanoyl) transferase LipB [Candidatus Neomarinimicrobiota bacterium]
MIDLSTSTNLLLDIQSISDEKVNCFWLGTQPYEPIWELQKSIHSLRKDGKIEDVFLLLEHDHVYTFGKNANHDHLLPTYPEEAEVVQIDRGGDITYHGPGQLVGYPLIDLHGYEKSVSWYMRTLEAVIIDTLKKIEISADRKDDLTGVWVEDEKICAMGVRLSRWVTMHGFALNFNPEMRFFDGMIPCGIFEHGVTSIKDCIKIDLTVHKLAQLICETFKVKFIDECVEKETT